MKRSDYAKIIFLTRGSMVGVGCLLAALSACTAYKDARDPQLSNMTLDANTMPESSVSVPLPDPPPARRLSRAEGASLWQPGATGFFGDHRAVRVGDILTVAIEIDDSAQLENRTTRSRSASEKLAAPQALGYQNKLHNLLPGSQADAFTPSDALNLSSGSAADGNGQIKRDEEISLKVAVMITQVLPNGNLVVAGRQEVKVNTELRELRVTGIIRPVDIDMKNTIPYEKIAEARISYGGKGVFVDGAKTALRTGYAEHRSAVLRISKCDRGWH